MSYAAIVRALGEDVRQATRQLWRSPSFTLTVIITLALGIGATTALFALVNGILLKPISLSHPEQLVVLAERVREIQDVYPTLPVNSNHFLFWQRNSRAFSAFGLMRIDSMPLGGKERPLQVKVVSATLGMFKVLGQKPEIGRLFSEDDYTINNAAIVTDGLWRSQYGGDPAILGKTISLNGVKRIIVGVTPSSFRVPQISGVATSGTQLAAPLSVIVPLTFSDKERRVAMGAFNYEAFARMKPGVNISQATEDLNNLQRTIVSGLPSEQRAVLSIVITPLQQALTSAAKVSLLTLLVAIVGLLFAVCINLASMFLARAVIRRRQVAIASALGARVVNIVRLAVREPLIIGITGGGFGIALAYYLLPLMLLYLPDSLDFNGPIRIDRSSVLCACAVTCAAMLLAGLAPSLLFLRTKPQEVLRGEALLAGEPPRSKMLRKIFVAVETAVSVILLQVTGLLWLSLGHLMNEDRGYNSDHVVTLPLQLPQQPYKAKEINYRFYKEVLAKITTLPGLENTGLSDALPLYGEPMVDTMRVRGETRPITQLPTTNLHWVSPGYLHSLQLPLLAGRQLGFSDEGKNYAIVSKKTARTLWHGKDPIGETFVLDDNTEEPFTVIGIVGNARSISLAAPDPMLVYVPYWCRSGTSAALLIRTSEDPGVVGGEIRRAIWSIDPSVPVSKSSTLASMARETLKTRQSVMEVLRWFTVSSVLVAFLGIYGSVSYSTVQRHREMGVRIALGAKRKDIYLIVVVEGLGPVCAGCVSGVALAILFAHVSKSLLFEVSAYNPLIAIGTCCSLIVIGLAACFLPARHAGCLDPASILRAG